MRYVKGIARFLLVSMGVVVLTSFSIDASDTFRQSQTALSILMRTQLQQECPQGTAPLSLSEKALCIDMYENAVGESCGVSHPQLMIQTEQNIADTNCQAISQKGKTPWTFVSLHQAKALCAKKDMRLPTASEWYEAALGTPDTEVCNTQAQGPVDTGSNQGCVSSRGIYDAIGNVWEWVDEEILDGAYHERKLPASGFVAEVDIAGVLSSSTKTASELFHSDYAYTDAHGVKGMLRGGFYAGGTDAGIFALHIKNSPSFASRGIGFRCVKDK